MALICWTPPNSLGSIGSVIIRFPIPKDGLTRTQYQGVMAARIDRLVADEVGDLEDEENRAEVVSWIQNKIWENEPNLHVPDDLKHLGQIMAETSDWIQDRSGAGGFPVPREKIRHDPETLEVLREETLEEFLNRLYSMASQNA